MWNLRFSEASLGEFMFHSLRASLAGATAVGLAVALAFAGLTPASASPIATVELGQSILVGGVPSNSTTAAAGSSFLLALNYQCSGADCEGAKITVPVPSGMTVGGQTTSSDVASYSTSGNTATFTMIDPLPAGRAGQVTLSVGVPGGTTPDGTSFTWQSTMSATNALDSVSPSVTIVSHAGNTTGLSISKTAGGAAGQPASYNLQMCVSAPSTPGYGGLAIANGSVVTATLPVGAQFVSAGNGGTYSAGSGTVSWTIGQLFGCATVPLKVSYPSSDSSNTVSADKVLTATWDGSDYGTSNSRSLGTASNTTTLVAPIVSVSYDKWSYSTSAPITGNVGYNFSINNQGNTILDSVIVHDDIPNGLQPTSIGGTSPSTSTGSLWVASRNGVDGIFGTTDDGQLVKAADFSGIGTGFGINVYGGTWPSGAAGLAADDLVQSIEWRLADVDPGIGTNFGYMNATVMATWADGTTPVSVGDTITNTASYTTTVAGVVSSVNKTKSIVVAPQIPTITVRTGGPGTLGFGVTQAAFSTSIGASGFAVPNPVIVMLMDAKLSLVSWTHNASSLPEPTLTSVSNWQGTGRTLLRWTFPVGTVLPVNTGYQTNIVTQLAATAWGSLTVQGFGSSASMTAYCDSNYFGSGVDTDDKDADGNITEVLCKWSDSTAPAPSTTANVTLAGSGQYQTGDVTGTAYTAPGSNDSYLMSLNNTGTIQLRNGILIDVLPRAGDTKILSSTARNTASSTFPVVLRGAPVLPAGLSSPVTTYYSTVANPCKAELSYSPGGCNAPNWSSTVPSTFALVTAVKVDFGSNVLDPFTSWSVRLPVTTPTTGATEPDFASSNPSATQVADDEIAYNSAAFVATSVASGSPLLPSESQPFALRVPSEAGIRGAAPAPGSETSTGPGGVSQSVTVTVPPLGSATLLDGTGTPVTTLVVPGQGTYGISPTTGVIVFMPAPGYSGVASAVAYRITDAWGQTGDGSYTPTVTIPTAPNPGALTSTGVGTAAQTGSPAVPIGGSIRLLNSTGSPLTSLSVPGVGDYAVDPSTGQITFVPVLGFSGTPSAVSYRATDSFGQTGDSTYTPTVTAPAGPTAAPQSTSGSGTTAQRIAVSLPTGSNLRFVGPSNSTVSSLTIPGEGAWTVSGQELVFTPEPGFLGTVTTVSYRVVDAYGQTDDATLDAVVTLPAGPVAPALTSPYRAGSASQDASVAIPTGGSVDLLDANGNPVSSLRIPGQGTYTLATVHGLADTALLTFVADAGFVGTPTPVQYRITDSYGQLSTNSYAPDAVPSSPRLLNTGIGLAYTGSAPQGALLTAAFLIGLGVVIVTRRRRERS
jgi:CshA-type fibril repeat protein